MQAYTKYCSSDLGQMAGRHSAAFDFKTDVSLYERGRPDYSAESVKFLLSQVGAFSRTADELFTILELGAGTGKFTRVMANLLKDRSARIIASDPQQEMCETFREIVPGVEIMQFPAEEIALPDASVHAVISAQGFHWFANQRSVSEIHRVLIPGGKFGLIWNHRDTSVPWVKSIQDIIDPFYKQSKTPLHWDNTWRTEIEKSGKFAAVEGNTTFRLSMEGGFDDMLSVVMCLSCIVQSSKGEQAAVKAKITDTLRNHPDLQGKQSYTLPYVTDIFWCRTKDR